MHLATSLAHTCILFTLFASILADYFTVKAFNKLNVTNLLLQSNYNVISLDSCKQQHQRQSCISKVVYLLFLCFSFLCQLQILINLLYSIFFKLLQSLPACLFAATLTNYLLLFYLLLQLSLLLYIFSSTVNLLLLAILFKLYAIHRVGQ